MKLVAFDYEEANGFFGSRAFVKDYLVPSKYELIGDMNIEASMNYNDVNGTQQLYDGFDAFFPDIYAEMTRNGFKGDFLMIIGRPDDKGFASETATYMRNEGLLSYQFCINVGALFQ